LDPKSSSSGVACPSFLSPENGVLSFGHNAEILSANLSYIAYQLILTDEPTRFSSETPASWEPSIDTVIGTATSARRTHPLRTILLAGLLAGFLDGLDAVVFIGVIRGIPLARVFQFIASGLVGVRAFHGGTATVLLGVAVHFFIAISVAAVYYALSLKMTAMRRLPILWGSLFGITVFAVMHYVIVPLSVAPRQPQASFASLANLILAHILFVGVPVALITSRSVGSEQTRTDPKV
jgi:hypothetical protein